jgi:hypothetical protein
MSGMFLTPAAMLFETDFALHQFAVFAAPIIDPLAIGAGEFD